MKTDAERDAAFAAVLAQVKRFERTYRAFHETQAEGRTLAMRLKSGGMLGKFGKPLDMGYITELIARAEHDPVAFDVACSVVGRAVRQGAEMPDEVRNFAADIITGERQKPKRRGKSAGAYMFRDQAIVEFIEIAISHGFLATRNDESDHQNSACDIVAEAFKAQGLSPKSYKQIKEIWIEHGGGN
jgi:hypothetical protein